VAVDETESRAPSSVLRVAPGGAAPVGWGLLLSKGNWAVSAMAAGGVAIHALSLRVVATVLPSVVAEIAGLRFFAWTTTVAVVSGIWGAALAASLAQAWGVRRAYRMSLLLFATGSVTCAVAANIGVFLVGRLFQGLGGGLLTALAYTTIRRHFPEALRTRAIVLMSGIWGVAALCGPLVGGIFAGWGFWRWAFWFDVPAAVMLGILAEYSLPKSPGTDKNGAAVKIGSALGRLALLGASVLAVALGGVSGSALASGIGLAIGCLLLIALLRIEQNSPADQFRLLPSGAYRPDNILGAVSLAMALLVGSTMAVLYLPYVAVEIGGYSPLVGGYLSAILAGSWTAAAFVTASAGRRWAVRSILSGAVLVALGLALAGSALIFWSLTSVAIALVLVGGGIGVAWAHLANLMMAHASDAERDISSAFISTNQLIAQAFASALAGMIANLAGFADPGLGGTARVMAVAAVFLAFALIAAVAALPSARSIRLSAAEQANSRA
jgi:MFS family permease